MKFHDNGIHTVCSQIEKYSKIWYDVRKVFRKLTVTFEYLKYETISDEDNEILLAEFHVCEVGSLSYFFCLWQCCESNAL